MPKPRVRGSSTCSAPAPGSIECMEFLVPLAGCTLKSRNLDLTRRTLTTNVVPVREPRSRELHVSGPAGVGGIFLFVDA